LIYNFQSLELPETKKEETFKPEKEVSSPEEPKEEQQPFQSPPEPIAEVPSKPVAEVAPVTAIEIVPESVGEVSFKDPLPLDLDPRPSQVIETLKSAENIPKEQKHLLSTADSEPEKEVSVEKPFEERKVSSAPLFVQHRRGGFTPQKDALVSSTGSLSELLDICQKQQQKLEDDEPDTKQSNELEDLLAAEANLICDELNASLANEDMSENQVPLTPPRRSRSPRKPSPARNSFETKSHFAHSPAREEGGRKMDGTGSPMSSSSDSAVASSRINMVSI